MLVFVLCKPIKKEFLSIKSAFFKSLLIFNLYNLIAGCFAKFPLINGLVSIPSLFNLFVTLFL